jgi:tyrosinase
MDASMPMPQHEQHEARRARCAPMMPATMDSFAQMLLMTPSAILRRLKLPPWFPLIYERKDQAALTDVEQERFLCAYQTLLNDGRLGALVAIHAQTHYQHGSQRFLPWHRVYLVQLEQLLQSIHPDVSIPYWDWTKPSEENIPAWLASVTPTVPMPPPTPAITVTRSPGTTADLATLASNIPGIQGDADFPTFTSSLEGVHGGVHVWVGGTMSRIPTAPADPIFWMHHANLDRLWWQWQQAHPNLNPDLTGTGPASPVMDPWSTTEAQTRSITDMGYAYV